MKRLVGRLRLGTAAWLGMILAGCGLGAVVVVAWPEPTTTLTRLPYGESRPKTPALPPSARLPTSES